MTTPNLLQVNNLQINFPSENGTLEAVRHISFSIKKGETLGIVGESGSGKSVTALSILGLLPEAAQVIKGEIIFNENNSPIDLIKLPKEELRRYRGNRISMVFQEPMTSLNPVFRCGDQVAEAILLHENISKQAAKNRTLELFQKVKLPDPERIWRSFPHQLSGGQRQRVMIAMALSCNPALLIADEPTSALDVTVQRSILDLVNELKNEWGGSTLFITHDLGVVAQVADNMLVMQKGEIVEYGSVRQIFDQPQHPYTIGLIKEYRDRSSSVRHSDNSGTEAKDMILKVENLKVWFPAKRSFFGKTVEYVRAVDDVSFEVFPGETLGLVGESGSGKTTLGRSILNLIENTGGHIFFDNKNLSQLTAHQWKPLRKDLQIIFQDPYSSLNPRMPIGLAIVEPMRVHHVLNNEKERREKALELLQTVGLDASHFWRFPQEFSGGQRQRICIARALALEPKFLICDECVSSLDVTTQAQVLDLLKKLQRERGLTYIFISHDLSVVRLMSDRIAVMKDGKIEEIGDAETVWNHPTSAWTKELLAAIPRLR